jgi:phytoene dehydrogenase-like protein
MAKKKVIVIGGGIAGLSAASFLQRSGFDTEIFEQHSLPGGLCTSWERKGYTVDACIHWLVGSSPKDPFYHLWDQVADMASCCFVEPEVYAVFETISGKQIHFYTDPDRLAEELIRIAPEDSERTRSLCRTIKKFSGLNMPVEKAPDAYTLLDGLKLLFRMSPYMRDLYRWGKLTAEEYSLTFKNPLLQRLIRSLFDPRMSILFMILQLSWMHKRSAGYPIGGSLHFARDIERNYLDAGGRIRYRSRVERIIVENNTAKGIRLENGEEVRGDYVISAADGHRTIFEMLGGNYINDTIREMYESWETFHSIFLVNFGVNDELPNLPSGLMLMLKDPIALSPGHSIDSLHIRTFHFDPTLAPEGKRLVSILIETPEWSYWSDLYNTNSAKYRSEKKRIGNEILTAFLNRADIQREKIEMIDISTPATLIRYTGNWRGSFEGWIMKRGSMMTQSVPKVLPGLENFYMAGHWVEPGGGLPAALLSGRNVAQRICIRERVKFLTNPRTGQNER